MLVIYSLQQSINIPNIDSAERLLRNEQILEYYRKGYSYTELSKKFNISERWIQAIINIMLRHGITQL